ncbi:MAG: hypothetical protein U1E22_05050, partial [Coriobacteriia bacterium]|nr:hypothetical protein [Coriobacteriia bacterium]
MMLRRKTLVSALLTGALLVASAPSATPYVAAAEDEEPVAVVQSVDTEAYPKITLAVTLPAELLTAGQPEFELTENGKAARPSI